MAEKQLVTILIPVHDEQDNIIPVLERISKTISDVTAFDFEVLFVDDGSTDSTLLRIEQYSDRKIRVGYIQLSRNFGHQAALEAGLRHAAGDIVISMDGDLQHPPEMISKMIDEYSKGADVVQMQRTNTASDLKGIISVAFYTFFSWISDAPVVPNAADFRLMSRRVVDEINRIHGKGKLLRAIIPSLGYKQIHQSYIQEDRILGKPKYTFFKSYELAIYTVFKFSTFPANAMLFVGAFVFLCALISFIILELGIIPFSIHIFHLTLTGIISGAILLSSGVISWYLYFVLEQVRSDPSYVVSKVVSPKR